MTQTEQTPQPRPQDQVDEYLRRLAAAADLTEAKQHLEQAEDHLHEAKRLLEELKS